MLTPHTPTSAIHRHHTMSFDLSLFNPNVRAARRFWYGALALPLLVPCLMVASAFALEALKIHLPSLMVGATLVLGFSVLLGGVQYLLLVCIVVKLLQRQTTVTDLKRTIWITPLLYAPLQAIGTAMVLWNPWSPYPTYPGGATSNWLIIATLVAISLAIGYAYVAVSMAVFKWRYQSAAAIMRYLEGQDNSDR